jgi:hypothetical protein
MKAEKKLFTIFFLISFTLNEMKENSQACDPRDVGGIGGAVDTGPSELCRKTRITTPAIINLILLRDIINSRNCA